MTETLSLRSDLNISDFDNSQVNDMDTHDPNINHYNINIVIYSNFSDFESFSNQRSVILIALISALLGLLTLITAIGNIFVIAAILTDRVLRTVGNYLILSLAVADLMVACLVMPMSAVYEIMQEWQMGSILCDIWTSCDVLCCTASILHLLTIAVDRYRAVTHVDYVRQRSPRDIGIMILLAWIVAIAISVPPIFGWKDDGFQERIEREKKCLISQDVAYQVFATCSSFYLPLVVILALYWRIFQEARRRIRHKPGTKISLQVKKSPSKCPEPPNSEVTTETTNFSTPSCSTDSNAVSHTSTPAKSKMKKEKFSHFETILKKDKRQARDIESKREKKAAKTLAIITGVFIVCWMPFFVLAFIMPICNNCYLDERLFTMSQWLGYTNSMLNPIIYTIFSPDFRQAFKKMLCGTSRKLRTNL
ncbi:5-hydroxytryptamine receptor 2A-like [Limulus polyphemus]|uniref:5-hydroxytryptamine receptor 2A-like n=1 Tax=Limulus polyphemus TaxID=6850 RepID=A0ABM1B5W1_LIMPO|nr:5-hydroxytryptamine receptor 2A-like [Limulus polyphemus]